MKITKTQIDYLDRRLSDIFDDKVKAFKAAQGTYTSEQKFADIYTAIKTGKIKLRPKADVIKNARNWPELRDFYDLSSIDKKADELDEAIGDYRDKLRKAKTEIMDKVVLSDLMIEEAVAEFKKL